MAEITGGNPESTEAKLEDGGELEQAIVARAPPLDAAPAAGVEPVAPPASAAPAVGKRLVLFSDGTGNSAAKAEKTNVWRLFQALDQTTSDQMSMYDDGVGTSTNKYLAMIGGAFGWGLKRNVIELYKFVCRNYVDETTKLYGFGFSRGAFTIRVLTGLITHEGLVSYTSEKDLAERADEAYGQFRRSCFKAPFLSPVYFYRKLRELAASRFGTRIDPYRLRPRHTNIKIEFLGLWDTVSAYGMPVAELRPVVDCIWPTQFADLLLSKQVRRACHALSLDDERTTFHPIVWDESEEEDKQRICQVWFAGVHSNLGGGYPEDQLSLVSLEWMMAHARENGLTLQESCVTRVTSEKSAFARIYDAREGMGVFYRYSPRSIQVSNKKSGDQVLPVVHGSVIARMARGTDAYVPNSLPPNFLVLAPDGTLLPMEGFPPPHTVHHMKAAAPNKPQILDKGIVDKRTTALKEAMKELSKPDLHSIDFVLNTVWWRRVAYFASSLLVAPLLFFPWIGEHLHAFIESGSDGAGAWATVSANMVEWDVQPDGFLNTAVDAIGKLIPSAFTLTPWADAIKAYPVEFGLFAAMFALSLRTGVTLRQRMRDYGLLAWHDRLRPAFRDGLVASERRRMRGTLVLLAVFDVVVLALTLAPATSDAVRPFYFSAAAVNLLTLARVGWHRHYERKLRHTSVSIYPRLPTQSFAHWCRNNRAMLLIYLAIGDYLVPLLFGGALLGMTFAIGNRLLFDYQNARGAFCHSAAGSPFSTADVCWSSGVQLERGTRYRIIVENSNWTDAGKATDARGFEADNWVHAVATPLKRWRAEPWFAPIARVGAIGNEEYPLRPCLVRPRASAGQVPDGRKVLVSEFTAQRDGELFMFVNDAVLGLPDRAGFFYKNNGGTAAVKVEQVHDDGQADYRTSCPS